MPIAGPGSVWRARIRFLAALEKTHMVGLRKGEAVGWSSSALGRTYEKTRIGDEGFHCTSKGVSPAARGTKRVAGLPLNKKLAAEQSSQAAAAQL